MGELPRFRNHRHHPLRKLKHGGSLGFLLQGINMADPIYRISLNVGNDFRLAAQVGAIQ
jgi:hypothetical protein